MKRCLVGAHLGALSLFLQSLLFSSISHAYIGEFSAMGSYSKTNYGNNAYSTSRKYTASMGMALTPLTIIEISFMTADTFINVDPIQTTTVKEQTLGVSVLQALVPQDWLIQPYGKAGAAQYNRKQFGTVSGAPVSPVSTKSPSALLGGGVRVFLLRNFSLKIEAITVLPDLKLTDWKKNYSVQGGLGWYF